jgi:hypothetical protein
MNMKTAIDMLEVIAMKRPKGPIPDGMKAASIGGPDVLQPAPAIPALAVGSFTLWPMSYIDNRVSFGMVMYDPLWKVVNQVEKRGARYIYKISLADDGSDSATFWGQANQKVTMSLDEICEMMLNR